MTPTRCKTPQKRMTPQKRKTLQKKKASGRNEKETAMKKGRVFLFEGKEYNTYSEMNQVKRECNKAFLENSGLLEIAQHIKNQEAQQSKATATPWKLYMTQRSRRSTRFGQVGVNFEQMTKESYAKSN
jgi:hypothetical protein